MPARELLAQRVAEVVSKQAADGVLPAVFEKSSPGYGSRILPAQIHRIFFG